MIRTDTQTERQLVLLSLEVTANHYDQKAADCDKDTLRHMYWHYKAVAEDIRNTEVAPPMMEPKEFKRALERAVR